MPKQNTAPADYPQAVIHQIEQLAQNIVTARKRRKETQAQWAQRLGVSQPTMARIERGDPAVAMASYVMCMWLVNQAHGLADLIAPQNDMASLEREVARTRTRRSSAASAPAKKAEARVSSVRIGSPSSQAITESGGAVVGQGPNAALIKEAMRNAGLGLPEVSTNRTAAGLAALVSGIKKTGT
jgi:DNA-binding XRE family transcriptional regulator